jgi:glycosyltransferase involved in cell wall biosynthesis
MNRSVGKIAFMSPHCVMDFTNGAATATLDALSLLARSGFECQAFCNTHIDAWQEVLVEEILTRRGVPYEVHNARIPRPSPRPWVHGARPLPSTGEGRYYEARMIFTSHGPVPVTLFNSASTRGRWANRDEIGAFLSGCEIFLKKNRPDLVWTYGGDPVSLLLQLLIRRIGIPILFALHNFAYRDARIFGKEDHVIVPTEFARQFYRQAVGLECAVLPLVMDAARARVRRGSGIGKEDGLQIENCKLKTDNLELPSPPAPLPEYRARGDLRAHGATQYVTFVNPEPRKGVHVFARIAAVLSRRRPDIPLLLVEGAARRSSLAGLGIDLSGLKNLTIWPNTPDPRKFYSATRLVLMPSLMENAGFVAMEAMSNAIPVLASNRGGLPETIGDAAPTLEIPARYTVATRDIPTEEEVEPWVAAIIRLWDDAAEYERWSRAALARSQRWTAESLKGTYVDFFGKLVSQRRHGILRL